MIFLSFLTKIKCGGGQTLERVFFSTYLLYISAIKVNFLPNLEPPILSSVKMCFRYTNDFLRYDNKLYRTWRAQKEADRCLISSRCSFSALASLEKHLQPTLQYFYFSLKHIEEFSF